MHSFPTLIPLLIVFAGPSLAATIKGSVTAVEGKPVANARVDHTGKSRTISSDINFPPSPSNIRTDAGGRFRLETEARAFVIRKPGYASEWIHVEGDATIAVVLNPVTSGTRCKLAKPLIVKTKPFNEVD